MNSEMMVALGYLVFAGLINSAYTLPLKLKLTWKWENMWLAFTILGIWILPSALGMRTIPAFWSIYGQINHRALLDRGFQRGHLGHRHAAVGNRRRPHRCCRHVRHRHGSLDKCGRRPAPAPAGREWSFHAGGVLISLGLALTIFGVVLCGLAGRTTRERRSRENRTARQCRLPAGLYFCRVGRHLRIDAQFRAGGRSA